MSEMRIDFGPGYRLYYARLGDELIFLLAGGDKASQPGDIQRAVTLLKASIEVQGWKLQ